MSNRVIRLIGEINEEAFEKFSEQLAKFEESPNKPVYLDLSSGGGSAYDALAFAARIRLSACNIHIRAYGLVASAAVIILAVGDIRHMASECWVMVHEDSAELTGDVVHLERESKHLRELEDQWVQILEDNTKTDWRVWRQLHKDCAYLTPQKCLEYGLIDGVI